MLLWLREPRRYPVPVTGPATPATQFASAAVRHHDDATHLCHHARYASADHLSGFAGECFLKAILFTFLGAQMDSSGKPYSQTPAGAVKHRHLPSLWGQLSLVATGRSGAEFAALLAGANPFIAWDVADRYCDGTAITPDRAWSHLAAASMIRRIFQQAQIRGALP